MSTARKYELVYITPPETTDEALAELHTQVEEMVTAGGGTLDSTENWGRRKLAYEIQRFREGIYVLENLTGPANMTTEIERRLRVMDIVLRHLVIRVDEEVAIAERAAAKRKAWTSARRVRRGLPPERAEGEGQRDPGSEPTAHDAPPVTIAAPAAAPPAEAPPAAPADQPSAAEAAAPAEEKQETPAPAAAPAADGETPGGAQ